MKRFFNPGFCCVAMIFCFILGIYTLSEKFYLAAGIFGVLGIIFLVGMIRGLIKEN